MKKLLVILICFLVVSGTMAQKTETQGSKKFYINLGLGGGISTSSNFGMLYDYDGSTITVHPVGLGNGFNGYASFGYKFLKYVSVEISVNEFLGLAAGGDSVSHLLGSSTADAKIAGKMFSVVPAIVISAGLEKVNPYARFGLLIGAAPSVMTKYSQTNVSTNPQQDMEIWNHYYGGVALGYAAAGGVTFNISNLINIFTELQFTHATWSPNHSEITKYTVNDVDKLSTLSTYEKQVDFVNSMTLNGPFDQDQPRQELRITMPFSTLAVNVGITFKL